MKPNHYSSKAIIELLDDLEQMQHYLLMLKAAALAFEGKFNEYCPVTYAVSPFSKEETAEYFVAQFLELDPDGKLEEAMKIIQTFARHLDSRPSQPSNDKSDDATIRISISRD